MLLMYVMVVKELEEVTEGYCVRSQTVALLLKTTLSNQPISTELSKTHSN